MELGVGTKIFPAWSASLSLAYDNGEAAVQHSMAAVRATNMNDRLDESVRALLGFDHAIENVNKLPVKWFVSNMGAYMNGYKLAREAVDLLVASGVIPGAKERVGRQSVLAAKDSYLAALNAAQTTEGKYRKYLTQGWLEASTKDAVSGVSLLGTSSPVAKELIAGLKQTSAAAQSGGVIDPALTTRVTKLFDAASERVSLLIKNTQAPFPSGVDIKDVTMKFNFRMNEANRAAQLLVADTGRFVQKIGA